MYILKRRGASTDRSPGNTILQESAFALLFAQVQHKLRDEIIFIMKLTSDLSGITFVHACITECTILH